MLRLAWLGASLCLVAAVAACDTPDPAAVDSAALRPAAVLTGAFVPRQLSGTIVGSDEYGAPCGGGAGIAITSTGVGTVSHLGKTVMVATTCVNLSDFSAIGDAPYTMTAADGSEFGGLLTDVVYTAYGFDMYCSVTWGTGRFEGVTGEVVFPTQSTYSGQWSSGVEGSISY